MNTQNNIHLIGVPIGGNQGLVWNDLHSEREDICEALIQDARALARESDECEVTHDITTSDWHRELLQSRLRKIDDALDRLMSDSYGNCRKCGRAIEGTKLELDPAMAFCPACWKHELRQTRPVSLRRDSVDAAPSQVEVELEKLQPFDTILIRTLNSDYRILLLDPQSGRALVDGGRYLIEPAEALISGSTLPGSSFKLGTIATGYHLVMWVGKRIVNTSLIRSIDVTHSKSVEATTAYVH
jgi:RNA polymerase-binding transcription factor DksA